MSKTCTYRKTKAGEWVVMGPVSVVKPGAVVTVTKKDGTSKTERIESVGKAFDGMRYGYLRRRDTGPRVCDECGEFAERGTVCWETGMRH